jgi:hypothetical protein
MKIKSIAAVGAMGVGLGIASMVGAGTASAECEGVPVLQGNIICNIESQTNSFLTSTDPFYNYNVLMNGNEDAPELGLLDQPSTFIRSVGGFALSGPASPGGPPAPDTTPPGTPPS